MGTKRIGLARVQALIENLKREVQLNQTTLVGSLQKTISLTGAGAEKILTADDNGALIILGGSNASTVELPVVSDGLRFTVYATTLTEQRLQELRWSTRWELLWSIQRLVTVLSFILMGQIGTSRAGSTTPRLSVFNIQ